MWHVLTITTVHHLHHTGRVRKQLLQGSHGPCFLKDKPQSPSLQLTLGLHLAPSSLSTLLFKSPSPSALNSAGVGGLPEGLSFLPEESKSCSSYPSQFGVAAHVYSQLQWSTGVAGGTPVGRLGSSRPPL